jgi:hypothetical protein
LAGLRQPTSTGQSHQGAGHKPQTNVLSLDWAAALEEMQVTSILAFMLNQKPNWPTLTVEPLVSRLKEREAM